MDAGKNSIFDPMDVSSNLAGVPIVEDEARSTDPAKPSSLAVAVGEAGGSSSATKIKLKMPKAAEEAADSAAKEFSHVCKECGKGFNSGKALGGHMSSAHVQAKDKLKMKRIADGEEEDEKYTCKICSKDFPTSKGLYGHMRLHPERQWRGMAPSPNHPHKFSAYRSALQLGGTGNEENYINGGGVDVDSHGDQDQEVNNDADLGGDGDDGEMRRARHNLTDFVGSGWSSVGKRGQKFGVKIFDFEEFSDDEQHDELVRAARDLVGLARGTRHPNEVDTSAESVYSLDGDAADEDSEETLIAKTGDGDQVAIDFVGLGSDLMKNDDGQNLDDDGIGDLMKNDDGQNLDDDGIGAKRKKLAGNEMGSGKKKRKLTVINAAQQGDTAVTPPKETFRCTTCNKTFSSHQALGGHRSSHNKVKIHVQNAVDPPVPIEDPRTPSTKLALAPDWAGALEKAGGSSSDAPDQILTPHDCEVCGKRFSTGQALGGHKRCHYTGFSSAAQSPSRLDGTGGDKPERKVHEFDLNVAPEDAPEE